MKKVLWFDTETTGLDPLKNDIITFSAILDYGLKNSSVIDSIDLQMQPFSYDNIVPEALAVNGYSIEDIRKFQNPLEAHEFLLKFLSRHINKYDISDKAYCGGYNVQFDIDFLSSFFKKCNDNYLGSFLNWKYLDPRPLLYHKDFQSELNLQNYKLVTVCKHFKIDFETKAHNSMSDIKATRELWYMLNESKI